MADPTPTAYDIVAYPGHAYIQTHPDHIATLARLCGFDPALIETCRVLEVGCGELRCACWTSTSIRRRCTRQPGERPRTSRLVRLQAETGDVVTSLLHQSVKVDAAAIRLLRLLDGQRNREALVAEMNASPGEIDGALAQLAHLALLEG